MNLQPLLDQLSHWFPPTLAPLTLGLWLAGLMLMQHLAHRHGR